MNLRYTYYLKALLLSAGWFVVLLLPSTSRDWLLSGPSWWHLVLLSLSGVLMAHVCNEIIAAASDWTGRLVRAAVLPLCGAFLYLSLYIGGTWIQQLLHGGLTNLHDSLSLLLFGMLNTVLSFWIVIPYGLICQCILENEAIEQDL